MHILKELEEMTNGDLNSQLKFLFEVRKGKLAEHQRKANVQSSYYETSKFIETFKIVLVSQATVK